MRAGIVTPVVSLNPRFYQEWEAVAGIEEIAAIAVLADRIGYHHVTCSDHVAIKEDKVHLRGTSYWDPLATLGYLAAVTERVRLATHVLVLGLQHPLAIAKRYGTLDRISVGRLILGVGVGSAEEEFELLGASFERRGSRADDAIRALRASFATEHPSYDGEHYHYDGWIVKPCGVQQDMPIWIGGRSARSLRRAVELGDGWAPQGARHTTFREMVAHAFDTDAYRARTRPFEVILSTPPELDPSKDSAQLMDAIGELHELGCTMLNVRAPHRSLEHCLEQFETYADVARSTGLVSFG